MEYGKLEREIVINASPATVFEVITSPEHLKEWWPDEAVIEATPGAIGELVFGDRSSPDAQIPQVTVVEAEPPRL
ncbi:MAG TPA: SRPBCC family protein, partial [Ilumatobacteraceae bacterium]